MDAIRDLGWCNNEKIKTTNTLRPQKKVTEELRYTSENITLELLLL